MNSDTKIRSVGLVGLGLIAVWVTLSLGNCFYWSLASSRWPTATARVVASGVDTGISNVGRWWAPDIEYDYAVGGRSYRSTTIRYFMPAYYQQAEAHAVQSGYLEGTQTKAAYDPANPGQSVLEPGVASGLWPRALIPVFLWSLWGFIFYEIKYPERRTALRPAPDEGGLD